MSSLSSLINNQVEPSYINCLGNYYIETCINFTTNIRTFFSRQCPNGPIRVIKLYKVNKNKDVFYNYSNIMLKLQRLLLIPCNYECKFVSNDTSYLLSMPKYEYNLELFRQSQSPSIGGINLQEIFNNISIHILRIIRSYDIIGEVHGYLHPRNILFNNFPTEEIILSDFNGYIFREQSELDREWVAPELLFGKEATAATDVWIFGCVLYFIENGHSPIIITGNIYNDFKNPTIEMDKEEYQLPYDNRYGSHNELIKKMICIEVKDRISLNGIENTLNTFSKQINNSNMLISYENSSIYLIGRKNLANFIYNNYPFTVNDYNLLSNCHPVLLSVLIKELNIKPCKIIYTMTIKYLLENEKYYNFVRNRTKECAFKDIEIKHHIIVIGNLDEVYLNLLVENISEFEDLDSLYIRNHIGIELARILFQNIMKLKNLKNFYYPLHNIKRKEMDLFLMSVKHCKMLERLYFDNIMFTESNINSLCLCLESVNNLKELIFKTVSLQTKDMLNICRYFSCINKLEYLQISETSIDEEGFVGLTEHFSCITDLKDLCIELSDINDITMRSIGNNLQYLPNLNDLHLPSNQITDNRLLILCQYFTNLSNLSYLDLNYNCLSYEVLDKCAGYISVLTKLTSLMLINIEVKNVNIDRFVDCISNLPHFDYIDLNIQNVEIFYRFIVKKLYCIFISYSDVLYGNPSYFIQQYNNHPNNDLLYVIINDVLNHYENIRYLKLLNIPFNKLKPLLFGMVNYRKRKFVINISPEWDDNNMKFYFSILQVVMINSLIITGKLKRNKLFDFPLNSLQNFDLVVKSISIIDLPVSDHFLYVFYNSLDTYRYLESIALINIATSTNDQIELLCNKIKRLKKFIYTNNELNDEQFIILCNSFKDSLRLKYIDVSYNEITSNGMTGLSKMKLMCCLKTLKLNGNNIGNVGFEEVVNLVKFIGHLDVLEVSNTNISDQSIEELLLTFKYSVKFNAFNRLDISGNVLSDSLIMQCKDKFGDDTVIV